MSSFDKYTVKYLQYEPVDEDETQILDMDFDFKERSSEQIVSLASMRDQDEPCLINKMPAEIIGAIVSKLTPCMRACLGVNCKDMYQYFKYFNPKLVDLSERAGSEFQN
ncbi:hypothetical protein BOTNAR_0013g00040 [Botryotinia narcissicola]|uniref:Uncharacterized protein n=1 Tax=Botryotinia narcissicola TaxID=278944 RepID=A0A4Z1JCP1_9HELO|nr:hypothetical protein BOTNAR_0013g00040 [Botryotinia narcissicola]